MLNPIINFFLSYITSMIEPTSYKEAIKDDNKIKAMEKEIDALERNKTQEIVDLPSGKKRVGNKWIYKLKFNADGTLERHKARLVAKGFTQIEGI